MNFGIWWCILAAAACAAEKWQWPQQAASVRIDTKVRFVDGQDDNKREHHGHVQSDDVPFQPAAQTDGFYNRPPGAGRYPVRVETHPYRVDSRSIYPLHNSGKNHHSDGTLDSLQYCKCLTTPDCSPRRDSNRACGAGKFLCCYKQPNRETHNTEIFNEIDDERASLLPGREEIARPFPPPPHPAEVDGAFGPGYLHNEGQEAAGPVVLVGPGRPSGNIGHPGVLVGPGGPTGNIGHPGVLFGPGGPTGKIGPNGHNDVVPPPRHPSVLVGPEGPTNVIGPAPINRIQGINVGPSGPRDVGSSETAQRGVLVGPGGPTGVIGPRGYNQRPVLVGPGGPTGIIGPRGYEQRPVLVGPGGPTGVIGPRMRPYFNQYFGRQTGPGLLVGPDGPTGSIGPGRQLLVGPRGPTGHIGPQNYFR